jgi:hypothetical protein
MITNPEKLNKFNREQLRKEKLSYHEALKIYEGLHKEAVCFGVISGENIMQGFETTIKIAKIVNGLK